MTTSRRETIAPMVDALRRAGFETTAVMLSSAAARLFR